MTVRGFLEFEGISHSAQYLLEPYKTAHVCILQPVQRFSLSAHHQNTPVRVHQEEHAKLWSTELLMKAKNLGKYE